MAELLMWDWKDTPDWPAIAAALRRQGSRVRLYEVDTGSDEFAIVLSRADLTEAEVAEVWRRRSEATP